ncbi:MAG: porin [Marinifilaceae bacterium]|jgi:phosphate-selective porin OprO/OprP|nr:porin [Marinifilaceae bacterium]
MKITKLFLLSAFAFVCISVSAQKNNQAEIGIKKGSFYIKSADDNYKFSIGGRAFMDAAIYNQDNVELNSGSEMRDIRLGFKASFMKQWDAKFNISFAGGKVSLKDIFLKYKMDKHNSIKFGYFLESLGIEASESSKTTRFMHVSTSADIFKPGRNLGVEFLNYSKKHSLSIAAFGSDINNKNTTGDEGFGITSRLTGVHKFNDKSFIHLGMAGTYRIPDEVTENDMTFRAVEYAGRAATHIDKHEFLDAGISNVNNEIKYVGELVAATGPISIQAEYFNAVVDREAKLDKYKASGYYAQVGVYLNGANYKYKNSSARLTRPGVNILELVARYNCTDLNNSELKKTDSYFNEFKDSDMGGKQQDISIGLNWYVNYNLTLKLNYTHVKLDEYAKHTISDDEKFSMIQARIQVAF